MGQDQEIVSLLDPESLSGQQRARQSRRTLVFVSLAGVIVGILIGPIVFGAIIHIFKLPPPSDFDHSGLRIDFNSSDTLITFGDSYTSTFMPPKPPFDRDHWRIADPFTWSGGQNWNEQLADEAYGKQRKLFNYAIGGGCANDNDLGEGHCGQYGLETQIKLFENESERLEWDPKKTIFTLWIGINDVIDLQQQSPNDTDALLDHKFSIITGFAETLRKSGAQSFVVMNVPPIDQAPWGSVTASLIARWNERLRHEFSRPRGSLHVQVFDTWSVFSRWLVRPSAYGFANADRYCLAYASLTRAQIPDAETFDLPECEAPFWRYFWRDGLHVAPRVHALLADALHQSFTQPHRPPRPW